MKKPLTHTKCTVKLRKAENAEEWYLILESYPVFKKGSDKPMRIIEGLNRKITTPIWDKTKSNRPNSSGKSSPKPKRDENGVIQCRTHADREACIYADKVREKRQREYDNAHLYTDAESVRAEQNEKSKSSFVEYFERQIKERHGNSSDSIKVNWNRVLELIKMFSDNEPIPFINIDLELIEDFKQYLLDAPQGGNKSGSISQNTASTYFSIFKAALKQAFIDGYLTVDLSAKAKGIKGRESKRESLTEAELNALANTPCESDILKRAALFSALTGLRHCDIKKLLWSEIREDNGAYRIDFIQKKTKGVEYMPMSEQAYALCGERGDDDRHVFEDLQKISWISRPLKKWIQAAGIKRNITFHCFRHTYATLQLANGTDIYTVSKMLGHTNVRTTQIYAKVVDPLKQAAAHAIKIKFDKCQTDDTQE